MNKNIIIGSVAVTVLVLGSVIGLNLNHSSKQKNSTQPITKVTNKMTNKSLFTTKGLVFSVDDNSLTKDTKVTTVYDVQSNGVATYGMHEGDQNDLTLGEIAKMSDKQVVDKYKQIHKEQFNYYQNRVIKFYQNGIDNGNANQSLKDNISDAKKMSLGNNVSQPEFYTSTNGVSVTTNTGIVNFKIPSSPEINADHSVVNNTELITVMRQVAEPTKISGHYFGGYETTNGKNGGYVLSRNVDKNTNITFGE